MTHRWWIAGASTVVVIAAAAMLLVRRDPAPEQPVGAPVWEPLSRSVQIEVLNGSRVYLGARDATIALRRAGLDVVTYGSASGEWVGRARTAVVVRRRDTTGVGRVREVMGDVEVIDRYDESREVDLSVILGADYEARPRPR